MKTTNQDTQLPAFFSIQRDNRVLTHGTTTGFDHSYFSALAKAYEGASLRYHDESPKSTEREIGPIFGMTSEQIQAKQQGQ